jgi:hypothetical protein
MRRLTCAAIAACLAVADAGCGQSHRVATARASTASTQSKLSPQPAAAPTARHSDQGPRTTTTRSIQTSTTPTTSTVPRPELPPTEKRRGVRRCGHLSAHGTSYAVYASGVRCSRAVAVLRDELAGRGRRHRGSTVAATFTVVDGWDCPSPRMGRIGCQKGDRSMQAVS